jgi:flagellar basal-body rod modification protein FlgD
VLDLIGKEVQADSDTLVLNNGKAAKGSFYLGEPADCIVHIFNEQGTKIKDIYVGVVDAGNQDFEWDGFDNRGSLHTSGQYGYTVSALSNSGNRVSVDKYIQGTVTGVNMDDTDPVIYINDTPLSMSQIINVKMNDEAKDS